MRRFLVTLAAMAVLIASVLLPGRASAATVTLAWDASTSTAITGYKIYVSTTSGVYGVGIDVGKVLTYTVPGLAEGTKYFFVATAYTANAESGYSNEVFTTTPWSRPLPPNMKPIINTTAYLDVVHTKLAEFVETNRLADFPNTTISKNTLKLVSLNLKLARAEILKMINQQ